MSQALRKLTATIGKSRTLLVFINQIRMKIGIVFGNPETTTGGNALKFYSSLRLEVRKTEVIDGGKDEDAVGNRVRVKVVKNKVAPPFRRTELEIIFGKGVSAIGSLLDCAVKYGIIDKKGAWFSYGEEKVGQGRDNAKEYLEQHPDFARDVETKLRQQIFPGREFPAPKAAGPAAAQKTAAAAALSPAGGVPAGLAQASAPEKPASGDGNSTAGLASAAAAASAAAGQGGTAVTGGETPVRQGPGRPRKTLPAEAPAAAPSAERGVPSDALF
jgi:recombination protein RecA